MGRSGGYRHHRTKPVGKCIISHVIVYTGIDKTFQRIASFGICELTRLVNFFLAYLAAPIIHYLEALRSDTFDVSSGCQENHPTFFPMSRIRHGHRLPLSLLAAIHALNAPPRVFLPGLKISAHFT